MHLNFLDKNYIFVYNTYSYLIKISDKEVVIY